jgi:hypothetical protein
MKAPVARDFPRSHSGNAPVLRSRIRSPAGYTRNSCAPAAGGKTAGFGTATPEGWTWTAANDAAPAIAKVVAILKNEAPAEFVKVPLKLN